jgi:N,N'-diacetyllegionaminate synthase
MVNPVFVIAEAGVNHNGRMELALRLCDAAQASGADAVKFQTFRAQDLVAPDAPTAQYQQRTTGSTKQYDMLRSLELDEAQHRAIKAHCDQIGIEFFSTPFSIDALALVQRVGVRRLKLSSAELTHPQLIEAAARTGLPLLMSTGMGSLEEVRQAVAWYQAARGGMEGLSLLHCTSAYPAPDAALNLLAMQTLAREFGVPTGYSDHSEGPEASLAHHARPCNGGPRPQCVDGTSGVCADGGFDPTDFSDARRRCENTQRCRARHRARGAAFRGARARCGVRCCPRA